MSERDRDSKFQLDNAPLALSSTVFRQRGDDSCAVPAGAVREAARTHQSDQCLSRGVARAALATAHFPCLDPCARASGPTRGLSEVMGFTLYNFLFFILKCRRLTLGERASKQGRIQKIKKLLNMNNMLNETLKFEIIGKLQNDN